MQACVNRFLHNCREQEKKTSGELKVEELQDAENHVIPNMQQQYFRKHYKALHSKKTISKQSKLLALNPFLSSDGIIRSNSRLKHADYLSFDTRNPIILPHGEVLSWKRWTCNWDNSHTNKHIETLLGDTS